MNRIFMAILIIVSIGSIAYCGLNMKKVSSLEEENVQLKAEKIALLSEHEECLTYKEQSLKKELITKYLDSIVSLLNRMDNGHTPTKEETANFYDRIDFIVKNLESAAVSKEETSLVLTFIDSAKKNFEAKMSPGKDKD